MSEFFDSLSNQQRVRMLVMDTTAVMTHPRVRDLINRSGSSDPTFGLGSAEYNHPLGGFSCSPSLEDEVPAISWFYPSIGEIGLKGAIYLHGEGSGSLRRHGEILTLHFNDELVNDGYPNCMGVYQRPEGLLAGNIDLKSDEIVPTTVDAFNANEQGLGDLHYYLRGLHPSSV